MATVGITVYWLGPKVGGHLAPFLYSSCEPSELSQWLCYDDNTINIVVIIIIIIIIIIINTDMLTCKLNIVRRRFSVTYAGKKSAFGYVYDS